jgi:hypothetical protein
MEISSLFEITVVKMGFVPKILWLNATHFWA